MSSEEDRLREANNLLIQELRELKERLEVIAKSVVTSEEIHTRQREETEIKIQRERKAAELLNQSKDDLIKSSPIALLTGSYGGTSLDVSMLKSHLESMKIKSSELISKMRESKHMCTSPQH